MLAMREPMDRAEGEIEHVAAEVLGGLFDGLSGGTPRSVRAYREEDALLLVLRVGPGVIDDDGTLHRRDGLGAVSLLAMPEFVADAVHERCGRTLLPGSLSVCGGRGLVVFAFTAPVEPLWGEAGLRMAS
jgi:hypothetical protein